MFSKSAASFLDATGAEPGNGCTRAVARATRTLGVADRGGASYWMQLKVGGALGGLVGA
jgi:hypothetical protein